MSNQNVLSSWVWALWRDCSSWGIASCKEAPASSWFWQSPDLPAAGVDLYPESYLPSYVNASLLPQGLPWLRALQPHCL